MEDIVCFLGLKVFNSDNSNMFSAVEKRICMRRQKNIQKKMRKNYVYYRPNCDQKMGPRAVGYKASDR